MHLRSLTVRWEIMSCDSLEVYEPDILMGIAVNNKRYHCKQGERSSLKTNVVCLSTTVCCGMYVPILTHMTKYKAIIGVLRLYCVS